MSNAVSAKPRAVTVNVRERTRGWLNPLNLHWAGIAVLGLINLYFLVHMGFALQSASSDNAQALAAQQVSLQTAEIAARPLQGLDAKLMTAGVEADRFSVERLPVNYSEVAAQLGALSKRNNVRLVRVQYAQSAVEGDAAGQLTQVTMDANLSGGYRSLMQFLNGLERDRVFFLIGGVTLTGQQTGLVNLRIKITTYLRGLGSLEEMNGVQINPVIPSAGAATTGGQL